MSGGDSIEGEADVGEIAVASQALTSSLNAQRDTTLHSATNSTNYGGDNTLTVTALSVLDLQRTLIQFDQAQIRAAIPAPEVLHSARIDLSTTGISAGWLGDSMDIFRITKAWEEGGGGAAGGSMGFPRIR